MISGYRGRFAPSPTGEMHFGTARTALAAWLAARAAGGALVLRIEDLDAPRVRPGAATAMLDDLRWLGLDWDEGPDVGGPRGPYVQSARAERYERAIERLAASGHLFACTCSRKEIAAIASAPHGEEAPYPGTCRAGPRHPERPVALRFRVDDTPRFIDAIAGPIAVDASDFVVRRADGVHAYQLAVVVDDVEMEITDVVRGDDLLASTPKQIALHRALGAEPPRFAHVPLVLGVDGQRLAKRHGAISIRAAREAGLAPERVVAMLAQTMGITSADAARPVELVADFAIERISREPARIDASWNLSSR